MPDTNPPLTMSEVKRNNQAAGQHWFSRDTMRFFDSRVESELIGGRFFVTSEKGPHDDSPRKYSVRQAVDGGVEIETVGEFQEHRTRKDALDAIKALVRS